ncbi:pyridoxamine 5'-phosphate oxidase family protein [Oryzobacter telluris]|uniref:pyridoxamine 5'-phosphate oxidase family protein n=1 Tax=Oryzobacter telluris TaxID=3149179 RepID=UPI00370D8ADA
MPHPRPLSYSECTALLRSGVAGRLALAAPDGPHIVPLNYSVVDSAIVVRTSPYSLLGTHGRGAMVAFEVDAFDAASRQGWSVVARGRAEVVREQVEVDHIRAVWEPQPWASGGRALFLRIPWSELTGRRLGSEPETTPGHARHTA